MRACRLLSPVVIAMLACLMGCDQKEASNFSHIAFDNQYREVYEPPRTIVLPKYVPPSTTVTRGSYSGYLGSDYVWGSSSGTTTTPGRWTTETYTRGGRVKGFYVPTIVLFAVDTRRIVGGSAASAVVWEGMAVGASKVSDLALTGQMLLLRMITRMPAGQGMEAPRGWIGVSGAMMTPDGQQVWPTVLAVHKGSPAEKAGLRQWDIISDVDGRPTANLTFAQARELLCGTPGGTKRITVRRLDKTQTLDVKLVSFRPE